MHTLPSFDSRNLSMGLFCAQIRGRTSRGGSLLSFRLLASRIHAFVPTSFVAAHPPPPPHDSGLHVGIHPSPPLLTKHFRAVWPFSSRVGGADTCLLQAWQGVLRIRPKSSAHRRLARVRRQDHQSRQVRSQPQRSADVRARDGHSQKA